MVILSSQNKITDLLMILAWASPLKLISQNALVNVLRIQNERHLYILYFLTFKIFNSKYANIANYLRIKKDELTILSSPIYCNDLF